MNQVADRHHEAVLRNSLRVLPPQRSPKLLDQVRERVRSLHYSLRTEQAYVRWCRTFIRFHGLRHPAEMDETEVDALLTWLAVRDAPGLTAVSCFAKRTVAEDRSWPVPVIPDRA